MDAVQTLWQERQDAACGVLLRVEKTKQEGVALTSHTGRALRLRPPKLRLLTEVSPDGFRCPVLVAGATSMYHDMELAVRRGSLATSLDEMPRRLVSALLVSACGSSRVAWKPWHRGPSAACSRRSSTFASPRSSRWAGAQQPARHAGALCPAAGDGRHAGPPGGPPGAQARCAPGALRLPAAAVGPNRGPGLPLAVGWLGNPTRGGLVRRMG